MMNNMTPMVKQLLIINIIFYIGSHIIGYDVASKYLALFFIENENFNYWQIVSSMFMHAKMGEGIGLLHIVFNMYALFAFGSALEQRWGGQKFLFFYISCGVGAALIHLGVDYYHFQKGVNFLILNEMPQQEINQLLKTGEYNLTYKSFIETDIVTSMYRANISQMVGASGAIYGVLVAFAFMFPFAELMLLFIPFPIKAKYFVPGLLVMDLFSGVTGQSIFGGGIAHFAHIGGALFGFIIMWYWKKNQFTRWD